MKPNDQDMELWCDVDFCGNWKVDRLHVDRTTAKLRTGYIVKYARCTVT